MSKYGSIIDLDFNPQHIEFKKMMVNYFKDPIMTKVKDNFNNKAVYMVMIKSMLVKDKRYVIVNTPINIDPVGSEKKLSELDFNIIQTKELDGMSAIPVKQHSYSVRDNTKVDEFNTYIEVQERSNKFTKYKCDLYDIEISLLHKDDTVYQFPDFATILTALEKYSTLIFID